MKDILYENLSTDEKKRCIYMMENICNVCDDWKKDRTQVMSALIEIGNNVQSIADMVENNLRKKSASSKDFANKEKTK